MNKKIIFLSGSVSDTSIAWERILEIAKHSNKMSVNDCIHCDSIGKVLENMKFNDIQMVLIGYDWLLDNSIGNNFIKEAVVKIKKEGSVGLNQIVIVLKKNLFSENQNLLTNEECTLRRRLNEIKGSENVVILNHLQGAIDVLRNFLNEKDFSSVSEELENQNVH